MNSIDILFGFYFSVHRCRDLHPMLLRLSWRHLSVFLEKIVAATVAARVDSNFSVIRRASVLSAACAISYARRPRGEARRASTAAAALGKAHSSWSNRVRLR